jgi:tight adherence protein C
VGNSFYVILAFIGVFLMILSGGLLLFYREEMLHRISEAINPQPKEKSLLSTIQKTGLSIGGVIEHFENVLPKSQAEVSNMLQKLQHAGYRNESAVKILYGSKVLVPILLCIVVWVSGLLSSGGPVLLLIAAALGFLVPDFWLTNQIKKRQKAVRKGLPDVLDLLVICIEAGLSLDHATARTAVELKEAQPELCDELYIVVLEQRAGRPRAEAWKHMAERTEVDCVKNLVSMLIQAEQFGTSIARTLRVHSDTLRTQRVQAVEEAAAKTTIKLLFPLVLFIFPTLFVVVLGPAFLSIMDSFKNFNH